MGIGLSMEPNGKVGSSCTRKWLQRRNIITPEPKHSGGGEGQNSHRVSRCSCNFPLFPSQLVRS